jgi:hypothetical protein
LTALTSEHVSGLERGSQPRDVSETLTRGTKPVGALRGGHACAEAGRWIRQEGPSLPAHIVELASRVVAGMWEDAPTSVGRPGLGIAPQVFPLPDNGVQIEWHAREDHIEVTVEYDGTIGVYIKTGDDSVDHELSSGTDPMPPEVLACLGRISDAVWVARRRG